MNRSTCILVVDDDPAILENFSEILRAEGYEVLQAESGRQGLQVTRERRPDLVLLDVMLPDLGGLEVCRQIKKDPVLLDIFVVLFSGSATRTAQKVAGFETGADDYMPKRIERGEFLARIRTMLRLRDTTAALRASEQHYRQLVEILPDAVALVDRQGRLTAINQQAVAMFGYNEPEEFLKKNVFDLTLKERHEQVKADMAVALETGALRNREAILLRKSGERFPAELSAAALKDAKGTSFGIVSVIRDVTERKQAETLLRASEERFRQLAENIREVFWMSDPEKNQILYISPGYEEVWGRTCESLYASPRTWIEAIHPGDRERVAQAALTKQIPGQYAEMYRVVRPDGSIRWIEDRAFPVRDEAGKVFRVVGIANDITERKLAEQALRESEARKTAIMESALDGIVTIDGAGKITEFNSAAEKMFGCSRSRAIGQKLEAIVIPDAVRERFEQGLAPYFTANEGPILGGRIEIGARRADGSEFPAEFTVTRIDREGPPMSTVFIRDISGRKRAEEQIATLAHAVESTAEPICITDMEDRFTFVNRAFQKAYGYAEIEILGKTPGILFSQNNPPSLLPEVLSQTHAGGWRGEVLDVRKDGSEFPVSLSTSQIKDRSGRILGLMGVAEDITERKRTEEQIRLLADAVQSTQEMISIADSENRFTFVNQAFLETYGYGQEEVLGRTPEFLYSSKNAPGLCQQILQQTLAGGWKGELLNCRKDGAEFPISLCTSQIKNKAGKIIGLVGVARDISERIQTDKQSVAFSQLGYRLSAADTREQAAEIILEIGSELFGWDAGYVVLYSSMEDKITPLLTLDTVGSDRLRFPHTSLPPKPTPLMRRILQDGAALIDPTKDARGTLNLIPFGNVNRPAGCMMFVPIHARSAVIGLASIQSYTPSAYEQKDLKVLQALADYCGDALQRIEMTEALRKAEAKYRGIFENATEGIFQTTYDGRYLNANPALARMLGYGSPEELISSITNIERQTFVSAENSSDLKGLLAAQDSVQEFEAERYRKDGSKVWTSINVRKVCDASGDLRYYEGTVQDITRRKQAQKQNAALTRLGYGLSAATTPEQAAKIILDIAADLFGWDASYVHSYSQTEDKLIPLRTFDTIGGERVPVDSSSFTLDPSPLMRSVMKEGGRLTNREQGASAAMDLIPFGDVQRRSASLMHVPIRLSGAIFGILSVQSYTPNAYSERDLVLFQALADHCGNTLQRIEVAEALRATEAKYRGIFENATEGIFQTTDYGRYLNANPALARMHGYQTPEELISSITNLERQTFVSREIAEELKRLLNSQHSVLGFEAERYRKDGSKFWTSVNVRKVYDAGGVFQFYEGTVQEITKRKRAEKESAALSRLGYGLSAAINPEQAANLVLEIARELFGWDAGYVDLYSKAADKITPVLTMDTVGGQRVSVPSTSLSHDPSPWMRFVMAQGPQLFEGVAQLAGAPALVPYGDTGRRSTSRMFVTIGAGEEVFGILSIQSYAHHAYSRQDLELLQTLANYCGEAFRRIETTEALREAEANYRGIFENATEGIFQFAPDNHIIAANPAVARMFGYASPEELMSCFAQLDRQMYASPERRADLRRALEAQGFVQGFEAEGFRKDGTRISTTMNARLVRDAGGLVRFYEGTIQDITERKKSEEALRESEARLNLAAQAGNVGLWDWDLGTNKIIFSAQWKSQIGYQPQEISDEYSEWERRVHPDDLAPTVEKVRAYLEKPSTKYEGEFRLRHKDGSYRWILAQGDAWCDGNGKPQRMLGSTIDITARRQSEEQLRKLSRAVEQSPASVVITDLQGNIEHVNAKFTDITGYTLDEVHGRNPRLLKSGSMPPEQYAQLWQTITNGREWRGEFHNRKKNGELYWETASISPILDQAGQITHFVAVKEDSTERKRMEKQVSAFTSLGYRLSAVSGVEEAARIILEIAWELFDWDSGFVHLFSQAEDRIIRVLTMDTIDGRRVQTPAAPRNAEPSPMMRVVMREGPRLINRGGGPEESLNLYPFGDPARRSASMMYAPIRTSAGVVGIMSVQSYTARAYSERDLQLLQVMAGHCGDALHRIKVAEALREAESKYRSIFENATEGIFQSTPDGQIVDANPALARIFGYESPADMMASISKLDRQQYVSSERRADFKRVVETQGFVQGFEAENYRKDGGKTWVAINARVVRDASGQVHYYEGTIQDIFERKWTEQLLQAQRDFGIFLSSTNELTSAVERLLKIALQSEGLDCGGVYLVDSETGGLYLAAQHGLSARFAKRASRFAPDAGPATTGRPSQSLAGIMQQLQPEGLLAKEVLPIQHGGRVVAVLIAGSHVQRNIPARSHHALDAFAAQAGGAITRILAEQTLQTNRQLLEKTLNNLHDAVFVIDAKTGAVLECNLAATKIFGYARDEMVGRAPTFLHPTEPLLENSGQDLPLTGEFELKLRRKDGAEFYAEQRLTAIKDENGRLLSWVNVVREITERKRAEGELRQLSQRLIEAQETERSRVARELHDGVNQIIASAKMRLRKVEDCATELKPAAREILARCDRLLVQALEENRRIAHNLHPSDLDELGWASACRNFCKELASRTTLVVECHLARLSRRLPLAVELNLFRIVQEALYNAEKHAQAKTIWLRFTVGGNGIVLTIQDDGRGFDPKRAKGRKRERGGLGLANMRERARALGGGCEVASTPKEGTRITVRVPRERLA